MAQTEQMVLQVQQVPLEQMEATVQLVQPAHREYKVFRV
jgi:hypothetical protein